MSNGWLGLDAGRRRIDHELLGERRAVAADDASLDAGIVRVVPGDEKRCASVEGGDRDKVLSAGGLGVDKITGRYRRPVIGGCWHGWGPSVAQ